MGFGTLPGGDAGAAGMWVGYFCRIFPSALCQPFCEPVLWMPVAGRFDVRDAGAAF